MNKKKVLIIIAVVAICGVCAWGTWGKNNDVENINSNDYEKEVVTSGENLSNIIKLDAETSNEAYKKILNDFIDEYKFPDGTYEDILDPNYDMSINSYAIQDIDGDGKDELLLVLSHHPMVSMRTIIYDYNIETKELREELVEFPAMDFYENGVIKANWSHNQGSAGDILWPYTLYKYNENSDSYSVIAQVDAWNKSFQTESYLAEEFPSDIDKDGDGIVYYILPEGGYKDIYAVDFAEYDTFLKSHIPQDSKEIEVTYTKLDKANVEKIGKRSWSTEYLEMKNEQ